ncbi:MAG: serine hydrolase [Flavobacteriaceae bacterium]
MPVKIFVLFCLLFATSCKAQTSMDSYLGGWAGTFKEEQPFLFTVEITSEGTEKIARFMGKKSITEIPLHLETPPYWVGEIMGQLHIRIDMTAATPVAFIQTGHHLSHLALQESPTGSWVGTWNLLIESHSLPTLYVSLEAWDNGSYGASTFFKEPTYHYMWGQDFKKVENEISFTDIRSNIHFKGILNENQIDLTLHFLNESTAFSLFPLAYDQWQRGQYTEKATEGMAPARFARLIHDIQTDTLAGTHAVLIAQKGETLLERYFKGFTASTPHDTRSLSKSFAAALVGSAIADQKLANVDLPIKGFFAKAYPDIDWTNGKDRITLHHLLTMSSGLDAIDFGLNRNSYANEGAYQDQPNWTQYILQAPMVYEPGSEANYGSGNPHLLAPILNEVLGERLEFYLHRKLFRPLGISNYRLQTNNEDLPYFGGGWYFTPKDVLTFGQLYLQGGNWEGQQLLPKTWVQQCMESYTVLANTRDKNGYGYLFWHKTYEVAGQKIASIEARGSGGQYLFIVPEHALVVVITSGNYRNNKGFQPERIMKDYILPEILK